MIEAGMLRAVYILSDGSHSISESMVAGTVAGELSFLSRTKRNTNVVAERDSVLWKMDVDAHEQMGKELGWATARKFEETVLKIAVAETEVLMVSRALFSPLYRQWFTDSYPLIDRVTSCRVCEMVNRSDCNIFSSLDAHARESFLFAASSGP